MDTFPGQRADQAKGSEVKERRLGSKREDGNQRAGQLRKRPERL